MNSFSKTTQMASFPRLQFFFFLMISITLCPFSTHGCHEEEKRALLDIKFNLVDPSGRLSSWQESTQHKNCCSWYGIECSSESLHVISIDLRNRDLEMYRYDGSSYRTAPDTALRGILSTHLFNITHLEYLDLGFNDFQGSEITHQFSYLTNLTHLDLSLSNFSASISTQFNNLTSLQYLDLSCSFWIGTDSYTTFCLESSSINWVRGLENLQVLRLSGIDLLQATSSKENDAQHIAYLWNLRDLDISDCNIAGPVFPIHQFHNLSRLSILKMNRNDHLNSSIPLQLANLTTLSVLEFSHCDLQGSIPYLPQLTELDVSANRHLSSDLTRIFEYPWPRLQKLQISSTNATGSFPSSISNASLLVRFSAADSKIQGPLPFSISHLKYLNFLDLSYNNIQGPIPKSFCKIFSLQHLSLEENIITGIIPNCITNLRNLSVFDVSGNFITGTVSLISLINELNLTFLDLSANNLTVVIDQHLYPSKFILERLDLHSCNVKGFIPTSICNFSHLEEMDLSYTNLTGAIPSCIHKLIKLNRLDFSKNRLSGPLPLLPPNVGYLDLSNNKLNGEISLENGKSLSSVSITLNLNENELWGSIPSSLCSQKTGNSYTILEEINLSNNKLSGAIPSSIGNCRNLTTLNLSNNNLTGNVPNEINQAEKLEYLYLSDNNLDGVLPTFITKFKSLKVLDLRNNNLEGIIPTGLGSHSDLMILSLRSNKFNGSIPKEIFHLQQLRILDLALNNFSGQIPFKLENLTSLTGRNITSLSTYNAQYQLVIKGTMAQFKQMWLYNSGMDLSCNILSGSIPEEICLLKELAMLNLSHNFFSSNIPESVGDMYSLESLDLSSNRLSGHIPQSLTVIDSLSFLNLSRNNLSGKIPRESHFDTLSVDGSAFAGNELLCGFPLEKDCMGNHNISTGSSIHEDDQEDWKEKLLLYAIVAMGFAVGFWALFFVLLLKKQKLWFPYWRAIDSVAVKIIECFL